MYKILSLMAILLIFPFTITEIVLLHKVNEYSYKYNYVLEHKNDIRTLLLGNSHIAQGLIPDSMSEGTFNCAIAGREIIYDFELAKILLPQLDKLECVIIPFDYIQFYLGRSSANPKGIGRDIGEFNATRKCMYYKYMGLRVDEFWYWSEFLNSKLNFMSRLYISDKEARECDSLGFTKLPSIKLRSQNWKYCALPDIINIHAPVDTELNYQLHKGYENLVRLVSQKRVVLILLGTPMYKTYRDYMVPEVKKEMVDFAMKLKQEYSNIIYLDYTDDYRFGDSDFWDSSHLSEVGAIKFSKILTEDIKKETQKLKPKS